MGTRKPASVSTRQWKNAQAWHAWSEILKYQGSTPTQMTPLALSNIANYVESLEDAVDMLWDRINKLGAQ